MAIANFASAQQVPSKETMSPNEFQGEEYYNAYEFKKAIKAFEKVVEKDTNNVYAYYRLAQSNYRMRDFKTAEHWANEVIKRKSDLSGDEMFYYIEILAANEKYDEARYWFDKYKNNDKISQYQLKRIEGFLKNSDYKSYSESYIVQPVSFNSSESDFSPIYLSDTIVYVSGRKDGLNIKSTFKNDGINYLNLYYVVEEGNGGFSEPKKFGKKIRTQYHEGPLTFYDDHSKVIFTQSKIRKRSSFGDRMKRSEDGTLNLSLYWADYQDGKIKNIIDFPYNNEEFSTGHPTVSDNDQYLIFSSNRPDGIGGSDLYLCHRVNNSWAPPINLGDVINTKGNELFPFLHGNMLYFASDGHKGLGQLDIFKVLLIDGTATDLVNLGRPINSSMDDFALITNDGEVGYFSSNRGTPRNEEIYSFVYQSPIVDVEVIVVDSLSNRKLRSPKLYVSEVDSLEHWLIPHKVEGDSIYHFIVDTTLAHNVRAEASGYLLNKRTFTYAGGLKWVIPLQQLQVGQTIKLENIYYDFDKASLRDSSKLELNKLIGFLEENPTISIELSSHTDSRGRDEYNLDLSQRRAQTVVDYLIESGIDTERIVAKGYGETKPVVACPDPKDCTKEQHQLNRRTEFTILSIGGVDEEEPTSKSID